MTQTLKNSDKLIEAVAGELMFLVQPIIDQRAEIVAGQFDLTPELLAAAEQGKLEANIRRVLFHDAMIKAGFDDWDMLAISFLDIASQFSGHDRKKSAVIDALRFGNPDRKCLSEEPIKELWGILRTKFFEKGFRLECMPQNPAVGRIAEPFLGQS